MVNQSSYIIQQDGEAVYYGNILTQEQKESYFNELLNGIQWVNEEVIMFGKTITTKRKVAFYANDSMQYTYSNKTKNAFPWTPLLLDIKKTVESYTGESYNACLLNLYHDGNEGMGWHADNEKEIIADSSIASVSIGATRNFLFKHRESGEKLSILLENGSLLEMKAPIQRHWLHSLPKSTKVKEARINLTFRQMLE
jgi:alkylated DNA repair dioxygenase AlkB